MSKEYKHCNLCDMFFHPEMFVRSNAVCEKCYCKYYDNYIENVFDYLDDCEPDDFELEDDDDELEDWQQ